MLGGGRAMSGVAAFKASTKSLSLKTDDLPIREKILSEKVGHGCASLPEINTDAGRFKMVAIAVSRSTALSYVLFGWVWVVFNWAWAFVLDRLEGSTKEEALGAT